MNILWQHAVSGEAKWFPGLLGLAALPGSYVAPKSKNPVRSSAQAESLSNERPALEVPCNDGFLPCPDCPQGFKTKAGVSLNPRRAHPEAYHLASMSQPGVKERWDFEKKVLLATAKLLMESAGGVVSNKELEKISKRTAETIKKARTPGHRTHDDQYEESASSTLVTGTHDSRVEEAQASETQALRTHDSVVEGAAALETQANLSTAPSLPSNVTHEQQPPMFGAERVEG